MSEYEWQITREITYKPRKKKKRYQPNPILPPPRYVPQEQKPQGLSTGVVLLGIAVLVALGIVIFGGLFAYVVLYYRFC